MDFVCKVWIWYIHQLCSHSLMGIQINDTINYQRVLDMCPEMEGIGGHKALSCHNTLFIHRILVFLLYIEHTHPSPDNKIPGPTQLLYPDKVWNHRLNDKMLHILVWWFLSSKDSLWLQSWRRWAEVLLPLRGVNLGQRCSLYRETWGCWRPSLGEVPQVMERGSSALWLILHGS